MDTEDTTAVVAEVFSSIQGEGRWVGRRQVFVRFAGCNLNCAYCDTRTNVVTRAAVERPPGSGVIEYIDGRITPEQTAQAAKSLLADTTRYHSISLTGGEPLLAGIGFINEFRRHSADTGLPIHLETNGTLPGVLADVIDSVQYISMDIKVPSATGEPPQYEKNGEFLSIAAAKEACVKVVFVPETPRGEIETAVGIVADIDPSIPFILQPATPGGPVRRYPMPALMFSFYDLAAGRLEDVRIIPQTHRFLRLR
jgi:7-carboxy-7-deazaguanine synthase